MKRKGINEPWFAWSDGRQFTREERKKMLAIIRRAKIPGESLRQRFWRIRAVIEEHEDNKKRIEIRRASWWRRAMDWLMGRPGDRMVARVRRVQPR